MQRAEVLKYYQKNTQRRAQGFKQRQQIMISARFDDETFAMIADRAQRSKHSMAEEIRLLVEWGLESVEGEDAQPA